MKKYDGVWIGADPEFFVKQNGVLTPICGLLGGTKEEPMALPDLGRFTGFLEDNVMAEFNIDPCNNADDFAVKNQEVIDYIIERLGKGFTPHFMPAARFREEELDNEQALTFGCDPDTNAYTLQAQDVNANDAGTLRTAGGHIHISWENAQEDADEAAVVARAFDLFVTMPMLFIEPMNERRTLYGKAGSMRVKPYGVECRQLSCFWLSSRATMKYVFNQTMKAIDFANTDEDILDPESVLCREIKRIIDKSDFEAAEAMMKAYGISVEVVAPELVA